MPPENQTTLLLRKAPSQWIWYANAICAGEYTATVVELEKCASAVFKDATRGTTTTCQSCYVNMLVCTTSQL
jgi:hypothetical protein